MGIIRKALYAGLVACVLTVVPIFILKLNSEISMVNFLKTIAAALGVPGAFMGLIAASGRVHDIDLWVTDIANFAFYFVVTWLLLKAFGRSRTLET
jgi:predicted membrane-bound spermidine synthase